MSALHGLGILTLEAIRDAIRRRIVFAIAAMGLLSMMVVDSCSGLASGTASVNDQAVELARGLGAELGVGLAPRALRRRP